MVLVYVNTVKSLRPVKIPFLMQQQHMRKKHIYYGFKDRKYKIQDNMLKQMAAAKE